eukprot:7866437-Pyramimonas_sp.AAC.1
MDKICLAEARCDTRLGFDAGTRARAEEPYASRYVAPNNSMRMVQPHHLSCEKKKGDKRRGRAAESWNAIHCVVALPPMHRFIDQLYTSGDFSISK